MGRFYTISGNNLYIYVTANDEMISLNDLPSVLGLFEAESAWQWSDKMAVCQNVSYNSLQQAKVILEIQGYQLMEVSEILLERYFVEGEGKIFLAPYIPVEKRDKNLNPPDEEEDIFMSMMLKLETARKEGKIREEVYFEVKKNIEQKLRAYERKKRDR